jgi:hypothetical protein
MLPPDPITTYQNAPLNELLAIMLRQFRRPLVGRGVELSDAEAETLAERIVAREPLDDKAGAIRAALVELVTESETLLAGWQLTFEQALDTEMVDIPGWESTAEFLEIANEKANAELRISTGSILLVALGDERYVARLRFLAGREGDLDGVIARRVLDLVEDKS